MKKLYLEFLLIEENGTLLFSDNKQYFAQMDDLKQNKDSLLTYNQIKKRYKNEKKSEIKKSDFI